MKEIINIHCSIDETDDETQHVYYDILDETDEEVENFNTDDLMDESDSERDFEEDIASNQKQFQKLYELLDDKKMFETIDVPVIISPAELLLLLIKFALINAISLSAVCSLFLLINSMFATPVIPKSKYFIEKLFNPVDSKTFHGLCSQCGIYIGSFSRSDSKLHCNVCNIDINIKDLPHNDFFVTFDPSSQIIELLQTHFTYYDQVLKSNKNKDNVIRDINDGKYYRHFVKDLSLSDQNNYITVVFNTDGAPLFKSSSYLIWPIYIMVNELPISVRGTELLLVGLWFGKCKPEKNVFLKPFIEDMNKLSETGIRCKLNNVERIIKVFCLVCCVDSVARAPMQGLHQFNGEYGCNWCLHPGKWVVKKNNPDSGSYKYPLLDSAFENRNLNDSLEHMSKGTDKKPCFGFKRPSQLINLNKFNIIQGFVPDYMHIISGLGKQFSRIWFGNKKVSSSFIEKHEIDEINAILESIKAPHQICRFTRSLKDKAFWKAREWENFILYYSPLILHFFFDRRYVLHWLKLVEALYILLQSEITIAQINQADILLHEFVFDKQKLYSKSTMTFNIHLLLHLVESVLNWGPLHTHSAYPFESGNFELLKIINAAKGVYQQVCRHINLRYSYSILEKQILPHASIKVEAFCTQQGTSSVKHTIKLFNSRYFGKPVDVNSKWIDELHLSSRARAFNKMVKDSCLFVSCGKENKRSDNSFGQLMCGSYVKIINFVIDLQSKQHFVICYKLKTQKAFKKHFKMLHKIVTTENIETAVPVENLNKVCVHVNIKGLEYVCAVPNLCSY